MLFPTLHEGSIFRTLVAHITTILISERDPPQGHPSNFGIHVLDLNVK